MIFNRRAMGTTEAKRSRPARIPRTADLDWQLHARCRGLPTDVFFMSDGEKGARKVAREEHAKRVCRSCMVEHECLNYAVISGEPYGIWGATTPRERRVMSAG